MVPASRQSAELVADLPSLTFVREAEFEPAPTSTQSLRTTGGATPRAQIDHLRIVRRIRYGVADEVPSILRAPHEFDLQPT